MDSTETRRIVLTGASRGLGRVMLEGFAQRGHVVFGCSRSAKAVEELSRAFTFPHVFAVVDVGSDQEVGAWAQSVLDAGGPPDLLINNAALMNRPNVLWKVTAEEFDLLIDVNIKGVANVIRHFVPAMVEQNCGTIVNFSSTWGRSISPEVGPYCTTKWAIEGFTQALAAELPSRMSAVPLNPGTINTEMLQRCVGAIAAAYPDPQSWAEQAVPFLLELGPADNGKPRDVPRKARK